MPAAQATVGSLVAKTLASASAAGFYGQRTAPPPAAFDVFSVQVGRPAAGCGLERCGGLLCRSSYSLQVADSAMHVPPAPSHRIASVKCMGAVETCAAQACTNTIMAHFVGMLFSNWLLTVLNKYMCGLGAG